MIHIKKVLLALSVLLCACAQASVVEKPKYHTIYMVGDPHYLDASLTEGPLFLTMLENSDGRLTQYGDVIMDAFVEQCIKEKPEVVVILGDITFNGELLSHQTFATKMERLKEAGIQPLVITGNHDIQNPKAYNFSTEPLTYTHTITPEDFAEIYHACGYDDAYKRDENSLSYVYALSEDCWILLLDTAEYEHNNALMASAGGSIRPKQLEWTESILKEAQEKGIQVITVMHHSLANITGGADYQVKNASQIQELFMQYDVKVNFCAHSHAQYIKEVTKNDKTITDIMTSAIIIYNHQFGEVHWDPSDTLTYDTKRVDVDNYVKKHNIDDPFLVNFEENAREYFKEYSTKRLGSWFEGYDIPEDVQKELIALKGEQNLYLFTGTMPDFNQVLEESNLKETIETLPEEAYNRLMNGVNNYPNYGNHAVIQMHENGVD